MENELVRLIGGTIIMASANKMQVQLPNGDIELVQFWTECLNCKAVCQLRASDGVPQPKDGE